MSAQGPLDLTLVAVQSHVDEIAHDQSAEIAQPQLSRDFFGRLDVNLQGRFLRIVRTSESPAVHVDRHHRLRAVDHQRTAGGQGYVAHVDPLDLFLDAESVEQRVAPAINLGIAVVRRRERRR